MLKKVLSALVGSQRTSFREYAEIESHHCQVAPRIAGMSSLSPCGRYLVAVMNDRIMIFDRRSGTSRPIVLNDSQQSGMALNVTEFSSLSTTGGYVYIGTVHRLVYEVELSTGATKKFTHPDLGLVAHMSVVGRQMLTCSVDTVWRFWDLRDGDGILKPRRSQTVPDNQIILALALSPVDSTRGLVSSGADCLYVDFTSGETLLRLKGHADAVRTCVIQDSLALTGSFDMSVLVRFIAVLARQRDDEATNHVYEKGMGSTDRSAQTSPRGSLMVCVRSGPFLRWTEGGYMQSGQDSQDLGFLQH